MNAKIFSKSNRFEEKTTKAHQGKRNRRLMYPRTVGSSPLWLKILFSTLFQL
jgi:hypothetical protein